MPGHQCRFAVRALAASPCVLFLEASVGRITLDGLSPASITHPKVSICTVRRSLCGGYFLELLRCPTNPVRSNNTRNSSPPPMLQTVKSEPCRSSFLVGRKHTSSVRCVIPLCFLHLTGWTVDRKITSIRPASRRAACLSCVTTLQSE
jgi:hypothetical protein